MTNSKKKQPIAQPRYLQHMNMKTTMESCSYSIVLNDKLVKTDDLQYPKVQFEGACSFAFLGCSGASGKSKKSGKKIKPPVAVARALNKVMTESETLSKAPIFLHLGDAMYSFGMRGYGQAEECLFDRYGNLVTEVIIGNHERAIFGKKLWRIIFGIVEKGKKNFTTLIEAYHPNNTKWAREDGSHMVKGHVLRKAIILGQNKYNKKNEVEAGLIKEEKVAKCSINVRANDTGDRVFYVMNFDHNTTVIAIDSSVLPYDAKQLEMLIDALEKVKQNNRNLVIAGHHPPAGDVGKRRSENKDDGDLYREYAIRTGLYVPGKNGEVLSHQVGNDANERDVFIPDRECSHNKNVCKAIDYAIEQANKRRKVKANSLPPVRVTAYLAAHNHNQSIIYAKKPEDKKSSNLVTPHDYFHKLVLVSGGGGGIIQSATYLAHEDRVHFFRGSRERNIGHGFSVFRSILTKPKAANENACSTGQLTAEVDNYLAQGDNVKRVAVTRFYDNGKVVTHDLEIDRIFTTEYDVTGKITHNVGEKIDSSIVGNDISKQFYRTLIGLYKQFLEKAAKKTWSPYKAKALREQAAALADYDGLMSQFGNDFFPSDFLVGLFNLKLPVVHTANKERSLSTKDILQSPTKPVAEHRKKLQRSFSVRHIAGGTKKTVEAGEFEVSNRSSKKTKTWRIFQKERSTLIERAKDIMAYQRGLPQYFTSGVALNAAIDKVDAEIKKVRRRLVVLNRVGKHKQNEKVTNEIAALNAKLTPLQAKLNKFYSGKKKLTNFSNVYQSDKKAMRDFIDGVTDVKLTLVAKRDRYLNLYVVTTKNTEKSGKIYRKKMMHYQAKIDAFNSNLARLNKIYYKDNILTPTQLMAKVDQKVHKLLKDKKIKRHYHLPRFSGYTDTQIKLLEHLGKTEEAICDRQGIYKLGIFKLRPKMSVDFDFKIDAPTLASKR